MEGSIVLISELIRLSQSSYQAGLSETENRECDALVPHILIPAYAYMLDSQVDNYPFNVFSYCGPYDI